ncbi:MAG: hypothetical protein IRZ03_13210 [Acidobacterium ailaaui]|nr:hypothetical protein [Pseudacidobacterium ailaaui]
MKYKKIKIVNENSSTALGAAGEYLTKYFIKRSLKPTKGWKFAKRAIGKDDGVIIFNDWFGNKKRDKTTKNIK